MCEVGDQEMKLQLRALNESLAELVELAAIAPGGHSAIVLSLTHPLTHLVMHAHTHALHAVQFIPNSG